MASSISSDFRVKHGLVVATTATVQSTTNSVSTDTGALQVSGGVGVGLDVYVGGSINIKNTSYVAGAEILTTASIVSGGVGVSSITAGTDTAVSFKTGDITIWNTSTLQSVTDRGSETSNAVNITNDTVSVDTASGALTVAGGVGIGGDVYIGGNVTGGGIRTTTANTAPLTPTVGDIWYDTVTDTTNRFTYDGSSYFWLDITGPAVANANTQGMTATTIGANLVPTADATYTLGNPTHRWKSLYLGTSTLYVQDSESGSNVGINVQSGVLFINGAKQPYLTKDNGVAGVVGSTNQISVTPLGDGAYQLGTPQNLNTTATVRFGDLTVDNLNVLSTLTSVIPSVLEGKIIRLASSSTQASQIDGGGIILGTSTWATSILYDLASNFWTISDSTGLHANSLTANLTTVTDLTVIGGAHFGYANLALNYPDTLLQLDSSADAYTQVVFQNHSNSTQASADYVITGNVGDDTTNYIDMGWANSGWDGTQPNSLGTAVQANDGYLYAQGQTGTGNLVVGTTTPGSALKTVVGGPGSANIISVATETAITYSVDLVPSQDAVYNLGLVGQRWKTLYVGTGSLYIQDVTLRTDAEITVDNGIMKINGANQLQVGQLKFVNNSIQSTSTSLNISIGTTGDTGNLTVNRNIVISPTNTLGFTDPVTNSTATFSISGGTVFINGAAQLLLPVAALNTVTSTGTNVTLNLGNYGDTGVIQINRTLEFPNSTKQTTAWNSTATVAWNQITGVPSVVGPTGPQGPSGPAGINGVSSITAGTGTAVSTSTGAVTIWALPAQAITSTGTTQTTGLTVDLSGPTFVTWQPSGNGTRTITLTGFTPGRKVELWITPHATNDIFTVTGVTTSQCSNGKNTFTINGVGAAAQKSFKLQFYCTTNDISGVWVYGNGCV
jgi:hypothetical protein